MIENCNLGLKSTTIGSDFEAGLENGNGIMGDCFFVAGFRLHVAGSVYLKSSVLDCQIYLTDV